MAPLEVHLGRDAPQSIDVATSTFEASEPFDVVLQNHGAALHVHLNLDDSLADAASLATANHYVEADSVRRVSVDVDPRRAPAKGRLKVATSYGSETAYVTIEVVEAEREESSVIVDERLGQPQPREESGPLVDPDLLPVVALAAVALFIAVLGGFLIDDAVVLLGVAAVLIGIVIAGALLRE